MEGKKEEGSFGEAKEKDSFIMNIGESLIDGEDSDEEESPKNAGKKEGKLTVIFHKLEENEKNAPEGLILNDSLSLIKEEPKIDAVSQAYGYSQELFRGVTSGLNRWLWGPPAPTEELRDIVHDFNVVQLNPVKLLQKRRVILTKQLYLRCLPNSTQIRFKAPLKKIEKLVLSGKLKVEVHFLPDEEGKKFVNQFELANRDTFLQTLRELLPGLLVEEEEK